MSRPAWEVERDRLLREAGFEDIEERGQGGYGWLKTPRTRLQLATIEGRGDYYRACSDWLYRTTWTDETDRKIWEAHAAGRDRRAIAQDVGVTLWRAHTAVTRIEAQMFHAIKTRRERAAPMDRRRGSYVLQTRLSEQGAAALAHLERELGVSRGAAAEAAIIAVAREIAAGVNTKKPPANDSGGPGVNTTGGQGG